MSKKSKQAHIYMEKEVYNFIIKQAQAQTPPISFSQYILQKANVYQDYQLSQTNAKIVSQIPAIKFD